MNKVEEEFFIGLLKRMGPIPTPDCAFCKKKVREISAYYSLPLMSLMIEVKCHGDKHVTQIPEEILNHFDKFAFPDAFSYGIRENGIIKSVLKSNTFH